MSMPNASASTSWAGGPLVREPVRRFATRESMAETGLSSVSDEMSLMPIFVPSFHPHQEGVRGLPTFQEFEFEVGEGAPKGLLH